MSIEMVNGYVCKTCSDVSLAKKGVNPAHPQDDPSNPNYDPKTAKADKAKDSGTVTPAVVFGGALAGLNAPSAVKPSSDPSSVSNSSGTAASGPSFAGSGAGGSSPVTLSASTGSSSSSYTPSAGSQSAQTGNPYSPGNLLNVSA